MSDFFKKFKNVFVVDESDDTKSKSSEEVASKTTTKKSVENPITTPITSDQENNPEISVEDVKIDPKFTVILLKALEKNDQEGYDYLEFKTTLKSLSSMEMDEKTRFKSAEAMASAMGVTVDNIVNSAEFYLQILAKEEKLFEDALQNQHKEKVLGKKNSITDLNKKINDANEKIQALTKQIELTQKEIDKTQEELNKSLDKMNRTKASFIKTYNNMTQQISEDKDKIIQYLK